MKYAADFRANAREALTGKWAPAVLGGLIASVLGGATTGGANIEFNTGSTDFEVNLGDLEETFSSVTPEWFPQIAGILIGVVLAITVVALIFAVAYFIVGSVVRVGYAQFNLDLIDRKELRYSTIVSRFSLWKKLAVANLLQSLYIILWTLLFIIPGIIAAYSYAMTGYILAEHPELTAKEAIARSKQMMEGNRWRLFCLELSFIGWSLLCVLTLGIGNLWLLPYKQAAVAAFYREVSGTELVVIPEEIPVEEQ